MDQQHQLETDETLQQVMKQSEHLQQQLTCEQEAANRRTRMLEEENLFLHQQVNPILSHITCSTHTCTTYTHESTICTVIYVLIYCVRTVECRRRIFVGKILQVKSSRG